MADIQTYLDSLRKDITFDVELREQALHFRSTWGLFSPREIDEGTRLLLSHIKIAEDADSLDIGCGYGPIGITLARLAPRGNHLLVDKDFVAVDYANRNIKDNKLDNAEAVLSNAFDQVGDRQFDIIVSNIPAKVGKEMLLLILYDALAHLKPGGQLYVVTINGLRKFMKRHFEEVFGNYKKLKQGSNYTVARAIREPGDTY
ncbi:class I SAM-dependent methyltransferase [Sulfuriflexus sp.]|uniref:class I SAM-dependent methyltransferase n=1 Tax=Sulfuriflexus sp. TaxID=2015443 RepID=UPI0028CDBFB2|nr:methyltransferase [Sulfuriflexus sp.]MDT8403102.1 methyltransferase [Sulfuriflexus sp.]